MPSTVGFGTAGLGGVCYQAVTSALDSGFRAFDTAEADIWYDQRTVGKALADYFGPDIESCQSMVEDDEAYCSNTCKSQNLAVSTKIPPWELTSFENIRNRAASSRKELVGFCDDGNYPLDVYYIHAPACWQGWHPRCDGVNNTLPLREAWKGLEAVAFDGNANRIGLSNVWPSQLLDIIQFVRERQKNDDGKEFPPPRMPDVVQAYADPLQPATELRQICKDHGIEFVSYSTLGTQHQMREGRNPVLNNKDINNIAEKHGRSSAEVVLSWALQNDMSVIPRSRQGKHISELSNLLTGDPFLDTIDLEIFDRLGTN